MDINELNWNYEEFCAYLLIYASYADMDFSKEEKDLIIGTIGKERFEILESLYLEHGDYERLQVIIDHKGLYYPTAARKLELIEKVTKLFEVDGEYSRPEKTLLLFLDKLL